MPVCTEMEITMECKIREWRFEDAADLAEMLNNKKILDNLRDGLPYPYTRKDAEAYITAMRQADKKETFAFAITVDDSVIGSIGVFRCGNIHFRTAEMGYYIGEPFLGKGNSDKRGKAGMPPCICQYGYYQDIRGALCL